MDDTARTESLTEVRQVLGLRIIGELGLLLRVEMVEVAEELVEAVHRRQMLIAIAEVVLAELTGRITVRFQRGRDGGVLRLQTYRGPRHPHLGEPGSDGVLPADEGGPTGRAALLAVVVGEPGPFLGDPVDVGRAVPHQP